MHEDKFAIAMGDSSEPIIVSIYDTRAEYRELGRHSHPRGQLCGLRSGLLTIGTDDGSWVVPADVAVWIPPHHGHYGWTHGAVDGWSCYVSEAACAELPQKPCAINASGLLREAIIYASAWQGTALDPQQQRIARVILDQLHAAPVEPFSLPMPRDPRLAIIARALLDDPGDRRSIDQWAGKVGISERTLSRRFVAETGLTWSDWRQRARLIRALEQLADGVAVTTVALDLGYNSVSAFITLFKRVFGVTPTKYFNQENAG